MDAKLFDALAQGDLQGARAALRRGADPNAPDETGARPLHIACEAPSSESLIELLIRFGATPHGADLHGHDALQHACLHSLWLGACSLCAAPGWPIVPKHLDARDQHGSHLGAAASALGHMPALSRLIRAYPGAALLLDFKGIDCFWHACEGGHHRAAELLAPLGSVGLAYPDRSTPLLKAAQLGNPLVLNILIARGARVNAVDERGRGALHAAVEADSAESISVLLHAGASLFSFDHEGRDPLSLAHDSERYARAYGVLLAAHQRHELNALLDEPAPSESGDGDGDGDGSSQGSRGWL